jgi:hypothetical protein
VKSCEKSPWNCCNGIWGVERDENSYKKDVIIIQILFFIIPVLLFAFLCSFTKRAQHHSPSLTPPDKEQSKNFSFTIRIENENGCRMKRKNKGYWVV